MKKIDGHENACHGSDVGTACLSPVRMCNEARVERQATKMGVAVTRKPTPTPGDHVKHPERLGVGRQDAGEAITAMVAGRS
jgi:hypothetical protein